MVRSIALWLALEPFGPEGNEAFIQSVTSNAIQQIAIDMHGLLRDEIG
jgi:hypothetical protein